VRLCDGEPWPQQGAEQGGKHTYVNGESPMCYSQPYTEFMAKHDGG